MPKLRRFTAYRVSAILFTLLGVGNVVVGHTRLDYYSSELASRTAALENPSYKELVHLKQLESRIGFYELVEGGGLVFLLLSGALLIAERVAARSDR